MSKVDAEKNSKRDSTEIKNTIKGSEVIWNLLIRQ